MGGIGEPLLCRDCRGMGGKMIFRELGPGMLQPKHGTCPTCWGDRNVFRMKKKCKVCDGAKIFDRTAVLFVDLERGMKDGYEIKFLECGDHLRDQAQPGDFIVRVNYLPHKLYHVDGDHLFTKLTLNVLESLCGFKRCLTLLDGTKISVSYPFGNQRTGFQRVTKPGDVKIVHGKGMPSFEKLNTCGDLVIVFDVKFPPSYFTSPEKLSALERLLSRVEADDASKDGRAKGQRTIRITRKEIEEAILKRVKDAEMVYLQDLPQTHTFMRLV